MSRRLRLRSWLAMSSFLLLLSLFPVRAHAEGRDRVQFVNDIVIREGEEAHDVVCILCSIEVDGTVHNDIVAVLGSIHVRGAAEHDAVAILGNISIGDDSSIAHDVVVIAGSLHMAPHATVGNDRVVFPFIFFLLPFLVFAAFVVLIIWALRRLFSRNRPIYGIPPPGPRL